jgi:hypothetical protein
MIPFKMRKEQPPRYEEATAESSVNEDSERTPLIKKSSSIDYLWLFGIVFGLLIGTAGIFQIIASCLTTCLLPPIWSVEEPFFKICMTLGVFTLVMLEILSQLNHF